MQEVIAMRPEEDVLQKPIMLHIKISVYERSVS